MISGLRANSQVSCAGLVANVTLISLPSASVASAIGGNDFPRRRLSQNVDGPGANYNAAPETVVPAQARTYAESEGWMPPRY